MITLQQCQPHHLTQLIELVLRHVASAGVAVAVAHGIIIAVVYFD
jgi:hypothetical protein